MENDNYYSETRSFDIFLSHSSNDQTDIVSPLYYFLKERGYNVFYSKESITGGEDYAMEILNALKNTKVFLLIWTDNTKESRQVSRELHLAMKYEKICDLRFYFYKDLKTELTDVVDYAMAGVQFRLITENRIKDFETIHSDIERMFNKDKNVKKRKSEIIKSKLVPAIQNLGLKYNLETETDAFATGTLWCGFYFKLPNTSDYDIGFECDKKEWENWYFGIRWSVIHGSNVTSDVKSKLELMLENSGEVGSNWPIWRWFEEKNLNFSMGLFNKFENDVSAFIDIIEPKLKECLDALKRLSLY